MTILKFRPVYTHDIPSSFGDAISGIMKGLHEEHKKEIDFVPKVNILENKGSMTIQLALPGYNKKHIEIGVEKDLLKIEGNNSDADKKTNYHVQQLQKGRFRKSFRLSKEIVTDKIEATFEKGILSLELPKDEKKNLKNSINVI